MIVGNVTDIKNLLLCLQYIYMDISSYISTLLEHSLSIFNGLLLIDVYQEKRRHYTLRNIFSCCSSYRYNILTDYQIDVVPKIWMEVIGYDWLECIFASTNIYFHLWFTVVQKIYGWDSPTIRILKMKIWVIHSQTLSLNHACKYDTIKRILNNFHSFIETYK